jgi:hypothetical protein
MTPAALPVLPAPSRAFSPISDCRTIFQYRTAGDVGSLTIAVVFEFGWGSGKTERGPLIVPGERQA